MRLASETTDRLTALRLPEWLNTPAERAQCANMYSDIFLSRLVHIRKSDYWRLNYTMS